MLRIAARDHGFLGAINISADRPTTRPISSAPASTRSLTGSTRTGGDHEALLRSRRCAHARLGGRSPSIVFADANLDRPRSVGLVVYYAAFKLGTLALLVEALDLRRLRGTRFAAAKRLKVGDRRRAARGDPRGGRPGPRGRGQRRRLPGDPGERPPLGADRLLQPARGEGSGGTADVLWAAARRPGEWEAFRAEYARQVGDLQASFSAFGVERGAPPLPEVEFMHESPWLNLTLYPAELDYPRGRPLGSTWRNLETSVRATDAPWSPPQSDGRELVYLSLGSLGSADVPLMERLVAELADTPHRYVVSQGPQQAEYSSQRTWSARSSSRRPRSCRTSSRDHARRQHLVLRPLWSVAQARSLVSDHVVISMNPFVNAHSLVTSSAYCGSRTSWQRPDLRSRGSAGSLRRRSSTLDRVHPSLADCNHVPRHARRSCAWPGRIRGGGRGGRVVRQRRALLLERERGADCEQADPEHARPVQCDPLGAEQSPAVDCGSITSCPAIRIPTVAATPIRGPAYVTVKTISPPIRPPSNIHHGCWNACPNPARLWCARTRIATASTAVSVVPNATASSTPMRSPSRDWSATWIEPARPAAIASTDAKHSPDTGANATARGCRHLPTLARYSSRLRGSGVRRLRAGGSPLTGS